MIHMSSMLMDQKVGYHLEKFYAPVPNMMHYFPWQQTTKEKHNSIARDDLADQSPLFMKILG